MGASESKIALMEWPWCDYFMRQNSKRCIVYIIKKVHKWDKGLHQDFPLISCSPVYKIYVQDKEIKITTAIIDSCYSNMRSQKMLQNIIVEK